MSKGSLVPGQLTSMMLVIFTGLFWYMFAHRPNLTDLVLGIVFTIALAVWLVYFFYIRKGDVTRWP